MVIGLKYGKIKGDDYDAKMKAYHLVHELTKRFKEKYGTILCRELLKTDLTIDGEVSDEKVQKAAEAGVFSECPEYIRNASILVEEILNEQEK